MKDIKAVTIKAIETSINERAETGIGNGEIGMVRLALVQGFITEADAEHYIDCIMSMSRVDDAQEEHEAEQKDSAERCMPFYGEGRSNEDVQLDEEAWAMIQKNGIPEDAEMPF